jgi:hypothetical protein
MSEPPAADGARRSPSLVGRLLLVQIAPLALLAAALALAGALTAWNVVEKSSDRLLAGSVTSIVAQIGARDGQATVNLSPWSLGLLDNPERDAVFYDVRQGQRLITGYADLPRFPAPPPNETNFAYGRMRGDPVRVAQSTVMVPGVDQARRRGRGPEPGLAPSQRPRVAVQLGRPAAADGAGRRRPGLAGASPGAWRRCAA